MESITDLLKYNYVIKKKGSERASVLKELYALYIGDIGNRKKANWKKYCEWCKINRKGNTKENQLLFKKSKMFIKEVSEKSFAIILAPQKLSTLYYMKSIAQDKKNRNENIGGYLLGSIK